MNAVCSSRVFRPRALRRDSEQDADLRTCCYARPGTVLHKSFVGVSHIRRRRRRLNGRSDRYDTKSLGPEGSPDIRVHGGGRWPGASAESGTSWMTSGFRTTRLARILLGVQPRPSFDQRHHFAAQASHVHRDARLAQ